METKSRAVHRADGEPMLEDGWSVSTVPHPKRNRSYSLVLRFPDIKPSPIGKAIHVKVYRKWIIAPVIVTRRSTLCFILLDQRGGAIQANAENPYRIRFNNILHINGTYTITGFELMETKTWMQTLPNRLTLILGNFADAHRFSGTSFPSHHFNFATYNELATRADNDDVILTDYIGCVVDVRDVGNAVWRDIMLRDKEGNTVTFTLWNEKARNFNTRAYEDAAKPTIMAVSSCWVKTYGGLQLSNSPATYYYFNPNIPETDYMLCMYDQLLTPPVIQNVRTHIYDNIGQEKLRNRVTVDELVREDPHTIAPKMQVTPGGGPNWDGLLKYQHHFV